MANPTDSITDSQAALVPTPLKAIEIKKFEAELIKRMGDLPQELYDIIQDFTFRAHIASNGSDCYVFSVTSRNRHAQNIKILQLNRRTRNKYAELFYDIRTFTFRNDFRPWILCSLPKFLRSVPITHRKFLKVLAQVICRHDWNLDLEQLSLTHCKIVRDYLRNEFGNVVVERVDYGYQLDQNWC